MGKREQRWVEYGDYYTMQTNKSASGKVYSKLVKADRSSILPKQPKVK